MGQTHAPGSVYSHYWATSSLHIARDYVFFYKTQSNGLCCRNVSIDIDDQKQRMDWGQPCCLRHLSTKQQLEVPIGVQLLSLLEAWVHFLWCTEKVVSCQQM